MMTTSTSHDVQFQLSSKVAEMMCRSLLKQWLMQIGSAWLWPLSSHRCNMQPPCLLIYCRPSTRSRKNSGWLFTDVYISSALPGQCDSHRCILRSKEVAYMLHQRITMHFLDQMDTLKVIFLWAGVWNQRWESIGTSAKLLAMLHSLMTFLV